MPSRTSRTDQNQEQAGDQQDQSQTPEDQSQAQAQIQGEAQSQDQPQGQDSAQNQSPQTSSEQESDAASTRPVAESNGRPREAVYHYDPSAVVRAELVRLGDDWQAAGGLYQAIVAYTEVLTKYPGSGAAAAATDGLVNIARQMKQQGRYYQALAIFRKLEALV